MLLTLFYFPFKEIARKFIKRNRKKMAQKNTVFLALLEKITKNI